MRQLSGIGAALSRARHVKHATGKPVLQQLSEIARLRLGDGKVMPDEYFGFGLFDDRLHDAEAKRRFIGQWAKDGVYRVNEGGWRATGDDKLVSYLVLAGLGAPHPKVRAIYHPTRDFPTTLLRTPADVADYLRTTSYPLFSKPADGSLAECVYLLRGYDPTSDRLQLGDGRSVAVGDFIADCVRARRGTIFQELIEPHPALAALCGPRVATMRLYVLNGPSGACLHRAVLRLPTGGNMYDNFKGGASGNLLAALDDDGRIVRVIGATGGGLGEVAHHPDTGAALVGWRVPDWEQAVATCLKAATAFPGLRVQAWDVAPTAAGPTLVELNTHGDLDLIQMAHRKGLMDDRWKAAVAASDSANVRPAGRSRAPLRWLNSPSNVTRALVALASAAVVWELAVA